MFMGVYLQNLRSVFLLFPSPSGGRCHLEMKYSYQSTLGHGVSEYFLGVVYVAQPNYLHLAAVHNFSITFRREMPFRSKICFRVPWVMQFQNIYGYCVISPKSQEQLFGFCCTFRRVTPFENEIQLSKFYGVLE